jgi:hypothetical protein
MNKLLAKFLLASCLAGGAGATVGCGPKKHASFVKVDDVALGRVVVYRNGVAYYERRATVTGGTLTVSVPRERVDDFLKSLTVVDAISKQPLPVSIPRQQADDGAYLTMKLQLPTKERADVLLTYVTEAPAWKPTYRVVVGEKGKVMLEGWAIVDNTSGEDWKGVLVGVGSSSALSFRYDLWSVRQVQREQLQESERFAIAPPNGISPYGGPQPDANGDTEIAQLDDGEIRRPTGHPDDASAKRVAVKEKAPPAPPAPDPVTRKKSPSTADEGDYESAGTTSTGGGGGGRYGTRSSKGAPAKSYKPAPRPVATAEPKQEPTRDGRVVTGDQKMKQLSQQLIKNGKNVVVEGYANSNQPDGNRRATDRANIVRNQLIDSGIAPNRIKISVKVEPNAQERVRLVAQAPGPDEVKANQPKQADMTAAPVGESHFASKVPMTVDRGASAMVSMVRGETEGEVVYLYDAESVRGNQNFAFRAVRFRNPTNSTLETGPVTVYGNERFIGEGLTEPIPPKASAVVPYALDRQIVVERNEGDENKLSRLVTLQRGILTAEVQHIKRKKMTITNRMGSSAKVFIRHTVQKGWTLVNQPSEFERVGDAHLFYVELKPHEVKNVEIAEATPIQRTLDLNADVTLEMMKVYVDAPESGKELRDQLKKLLGIHKNLMDLATEQDSLRRRLHDYKERLDDLHAQILTLQAVKTGGDLMTHLKNKMKDISSRVQKTTISIVDQEEKIMLERVKFQDHLAELTLTDAMAPPKAGGAGPLTQKNNP